MLSRYCKNGNRRRARRIGLNIGLISAMGFMTLFRPSALSAQEPSKLVAKAEVVSSAASIASAQPVQETVDAANLLKLATELKEQVDRTNGGVLSVEVVRTANSIEKLARGVKEKMKSAKGGN